MKKIKMLWEDEVAYQEFIKIPPFKEDAAEKIWAKIEELKKRIKEL